MSDGPGEDFVPDGEDAGDEVIAVALRRSLALFAAVGVLGALGWGILQFDGAPPPEVSLEAEAPRTVEPPSEGDRVPPALPFTDVTAMSGIDFVHRNGARGEKWLPETMGGGVVAFDVDMDGDTDLLFLSSGAWPGDRVADEPSSLGLFVNRGDGTFDDRTAAFGLDRVLYAMGAAVGDYDGDRDPDLYITAVGENLLLRNDGGRFTDVTAELGVGGASDAWSTAATFVDIDGDQDLDLFVCHYVVWSPEIDRALDFRLDGVGRAYGPPQSYRGTAPDLYRNDGGTFVDIGEQGGVRVLSATGEPAAKALAVVPTDIDGDGLTDLLVANDTVRNFFFHNRGGRFEEVGELYGLAYDRNGNATGAMGMDAAYHRNDSNLAFAVGNFANEMSSIYVAQDDPTFFVDEAISEGLGAPSRLTLTFGLFFFDVDLDGHQDLLQFNGHIEDRIAAVDSSQSFEQPGQIFWNRGDGGLVPVGEVGDLARPWVGRGAAYLDADGDGDLDVALAPNAGPVALLRNDQKLGHGWLRLRLEAPAPNTAAIGAQVEVETSHAIQRLEVRPTRSYLAQVETALTVGLGTDGEARRVQVSWPDGLTSTLEGLAAGETYDVRHPDLH
ncbi:MAG: CRTAC1 family protein [Acidobacteriota bacterium]